MQTEFGKHIEYPIYLVKQINSQLSQATYRKKPDFFIRNKTNRVIGCRPRVRAIAQTARRQRVQHTLVRILLRAEKDEVLEAVRTPVVRVRFGGERNVAIHERREALGEHHAQTCVRSVGRFAREMRSALEL